MDPLNSGHDDNNNGFYKGHGDSGGNTKNYLK